MEKIVLLLSTWERPCSDAGVLKAFQIAGYVLTIVKILVPILLIGFASFELGKAVISSDDKAIKTAISSLAKKAIAGVVIFFIPTIVNFVVTLVDNKDKKEDQYNYSYSKCTTCLEKPGDCQEYINNSSSSNSSLFQE